MTDPWPFDVAYTCESCLRPCRPCLYQHLIPLLRPLYEHAGLPREWAELRAGHAERLIGAVLRETAVTGPRWRRVWAAWSATRACRKRLLPGEQQEQYVLEWIEWGLRQ